MEEVIKAINEEANGVNVLKILYVSAYFAPNKGIHLDVFSHVFNDPEEELDAAVQVLKQKSLIITIYDVESQKPGLFIIKRVQEEIRAFLKQNGKEKDFLREAVNLQSKHLSKEEIHPNYIDHALSLVTYVREDVQLIEISIELLSLIVTSLKRLNKLGEAYVFGKEALKLMKKSAVESHVEFLTLRGTLDIVFDVEGQHTKAAQVLQEFNENYLEYSTVGEITKSLVLHALELCKLSKHEDALRLYRIIFGEKTVLDTVDSEILTAWRDYAVLLSELDRHSEAITILQEVFSQQKKVILKDDKYGVVTLNSLAKVFQKQGNQIQALDYLMKSWRESKKHNGVVHVDTLRAERDIGAFLLQKGDCKEALEKLEDVEKKFKQNFPESDLDILYTQRIIIDCLINLKEYDKAHHQSKNVYLAYEHKFGKKHETTLEVKYSIGKIFLKQGVEKEAEIIFREVYEGFHDVLGSEHDKTLEVKAILEFIDCSPEIRFLHEAAQKGYLERIEDFVKTDYTDVNKADFDGRRPLHYAALNGHISVVKYLLKMGAMYDAEDFRKITPYQLASDKLIKDLLESVNNLFNDVKRGIFINIACNRELIDVRDKNGYSLLHWAAYSSQERVVKNLLDAGADPKCKSLKEEIPLHVASSKSNKKIVKLLLDSVPRNEVSYFVNYKTKVKGNTALHVAAKNNDLDMVKCLLKYGASYDIENKDGLIPVQLSSDQSIINLLSVIEEVLCFQVPDQEILELILSEQ